MLPFKLSENERKQSNSPKSGLQKLSSSSFAEERAGRAAGRDEAGGHARTGSSPASMLARHTNTLPKSTGRNPSPEKTDNKPLKEIQKTVYADSGEEVFFF